MLQHSLTENPVELSKVLLAFLDQFAVLVVTQGFLLFEHTGKVLDACLLV
jgi:hypothetical protein